MIRIERQYKVYGKRGMMTYTSEYEAYFEVMREHNYNNKLYKICRAVEPLRFFVYDTVDKRILSKKSITIDEALSVINELMTEKDYNEYEDESV